MKNTEKDNIEEKIVCQTRDYVFDYISRAKENVKKGKYEIASQYYIAAVEEIDNLSYSLQLNDEFPCSLSETNEIYSLIVKTRQICFKNAQKYSQIDKINKKFIAIKNTLGRLVGL